MLLKIQVFWRWRHNDPSNHHQLLAQWQNVTYQKTSILFWILSQSIRVMWKTFLPACWRNLIDFSNNERKMHECILNSCIFATAHIPPSSAVSNNVPDYSHHMWGYIIKYPASQHQPLYWKVSLNQCYGLMSIYIITFIVQIIAGKP